MSSTQQTRLLPLRAGAASLLLVIAACGGEPPETLGGFALGVSQDEMLEQARAAGSFSCRIRSSRPPLAVCEGPAEGGTVTVVASGGTVVRIDLRLEWPGEDDPARAIRRFADPFGEPAWRDRPLPPRSPAVESYHTLWLDADSTRSVALECGGPDLTPPCTAELRSTTPASVQARRDTLLGILPRAR
jgi:hypothetical protein